MMKFIFLTLFILLYKYLNKNFIMMSMIMIMWSFFFTKSYFISNSIMFIDNISYPLIFLTLITSILISISSSSFKKMILIINIISLTIILTFMLDKILVFYILFEITLIPTFLLITKQGVQPERLQASLYLMLYMILASLPLLIGIIMFKLSNFSFHMNSMTFVSLPIIFILAFMVKLPMFLTHLWLPKAHVEAPLEGSMILASILLKLGGYGLIRFSPFLYSSFNKINSLFISISIIGASLASFNCLRQKDLKALIAYSSVAHMALTISSIMTFMNYGLLGAMIMMIAHGLTSSAMFFLVNFMYSSFHTRTVMMFKGMLWLSPNITFWWFIILILNMSAPPSLNSFSEMLMFSNIIFWNPISMIFIIIMALIVTSFSILIFILINHNKNTSSSFNSPKLKIFKSLIFHSTPLIFLIMKMDLML